MRIKAEIYFYGALIFTGKNSIDFLNGDLLYLEDMEKGLNPGRYLWYTLAVKIGEFETFLT